LGRTTVSLRLVGELPPTEEISELLGARPTVARRRGEALAGGLDAQKTDVWLLRLGVLDDAAPEDTAAEEERAAQTLRRMAPALTGLNRSGYRAELYVGAVENVARTENGTYAGGFVLPWPLVAAAAGCGLELRVSTLTIVEGGG
jgi:hypothetical protein